MRPALSRTRRSDLTHHEEVLGGDRPDLAEVVVIPGQNLDVAALAVRARRCHPDHPAGIDRDATEGRDARQRVNRWIDGPGALIVLEAETKEQVHEMISADPLTKAGIFQKWTIRQWNPVFINRSLLPE